MKHALFIVGASLAVACGAAPPPCPCAATAASGVSAPNATRSSAACEGEVDDEAVHRLVMSAWTKAARQRDGRGCQADLAEADRMDPRTAPNRDPVRARCEMLLGHCDEGRALVRRQLVPQYPAGSDVVDIDVSVEGLASIYCPLEQNTLRERVLRAGDVIHKANVRGDAAACVAEARALAPMVETLAATAKGGDIVVRLGRSALDEATRCGAE